jgi:hypothetical protein
VETIPKGFGRDRENRRLTVTGLWTV